MHDAIEGLELKRVRRVQAILFSSAGRKGFGLQTTWGHGFVLSHIKRGGMSCWSGPCYVYISGNMKLGLGERHHLPFTITTDCIMALRPVMCSPLG